MTGTGYSAYALDHGVITTGETISELLENMTEALNLYFDDERQITIADLDYTMDLETFFVHYKAINSTSFAKRLGINKTLISQYAHGKKKPSQKQVSKIISELNRLGAELKDLSLALEKSNTAI